jgi:hypothetical protein
VRTGDLAPDDPDLGSPHRALGTVDVGNPLSCIPRRGLGVVDALELEERGARVGVALSVML